MKERLIHIGAGSAMFTRGLVTNCIHRGEPMELVLVDIDEEALNVAEKLARKMVDARKAPIEVTASSDRRAALRGATSVVCTIGVGGRRGWEQDVLIPRKYGIYQPVGDTVMPGGTSRALRMIPPMVEIAEDVLDLAPDALFFNYGNPMGPVCRGIRKATGAEVVGLCIGVFEIGEYLARALGVDHAQFKYTAVGMNHLTWFVETRVGAEDVMPILHEIAADRIVKGDDNPASWRLLQIFGGYPAVNDRHAVEFFPGLFGGEKQYFGRTLGVDGVSFEDVIAHGDRIYSEMCEAALSAGPLADDYFESVGGEHQQVTDIIDSIRHDAGEVFSVNLPNRGQVPNLPADAILEAPAVVDAGGVRPIAQPLLPAGIVGTLATRLAWVETVVEAALEGSREKFVQALILDGAVDSLDTAGRLADDLLAAQAQYLPRFNSNS